MNRDRQTKVVNKNKNKKLKEGKTNGERHTVEKELQENR